MISSPRGTHTRVINMKIELLLSLIQYNKIKVFHRCFHISISKNKIQQPFQIIDNAGLLVFKDLRKKCSYDVIMFWSFILVDCLRPVRRKIKN